MNKIDDLIIEKNKYYSKSIQERSSLIVAYHLPTYGIGYNGDLLFNIKEDLRHFMKLTKDNIVVMGRGTWDSLPKKPLKNRINIIISKNKKGDIENDILNNKLKDTYVVSDYKELFNLYKTLSDDLNIFYIGGSKIYDDVMNYDLVSKLYITEIMTKVKISNIDTYFNSKNLIDYKETNRSELKLDNNIEYCFVLYERNI